MRGRSSSALRARAKRRRRAGDAAGDAMAAEQRQFQRARRLAAARPRHAEGGEGMLQQRQQLHRIAVRGGRFGEEAREDAVRFAIEPRAGGIVDRQIPSGQARPRRGGRASGPA